MKNVKLPFLVEDSSISLWFPWWVKGNSSYELSVPPRTKSRSQSHSTHLKAKEEGREGGSREYDGQMERGEMEDRKKYTL